MPQFSPDTGNLKLPAQDTDKVQLLAERWERAAQAQESWAALAKECVDFVEGRQWTEEQIRSLESQGRPPLVFNKIAPLVRLVVGYFQNNRTDQKAIPADEGLATEQVAEVINRVLKNIADRNDIEYADVEVFMDGIITGRGYYDDRIDYENNVLGEVVSRAVDPFTVYLDPDGSTYDLDKTCNYLIKSNWVSIDEVGFNYGDAVRKAIEPLTSGQGWTEFPQIHGSLPGEITPVRNFGLDEDVFITSNQNFKHIFDEHFVDMYRKNIRLIDSQHYQTIKAKVFIDLETGDMQEIPRNWGPDKVQKAMLHAESLGNPMIIEPKLIRKVRWTITVGDVIVFDDWSPYDTFTIRPYFPYFRRGYTQGMVHDLRDAQKEINKRRLTELEIAGRTSNGGWLHEEGALHPDQETQLDLFGSMPGIRIKVRDGQMEKIKQIDASPPATAMERLEDKADANIKQTAGINEAALGDISTVQSGRALEAKQRQAVIGLNLYLDNWKRTKKLQGGKWTSLTQKTYSEQRILRVLGEDGKLAQTIINQSVVDPNTGIARILNDITVGKYMITVDETPLSASFQNAQFEEALLMLEKLGIVGRFLVESRPDLLIDMSSLPRKEEWQQAVGAAVQQAQAAEAANAAAAGPPGAPATAGPSLVEGARPGGNVVPIDPATGRAG